MKNVRAVIFDLYGTLIRIHTDEGDLSRLWQPLSLFYRYAGADYTPEALLDAYGKAVRDEEQVLTGQKRTPWVEINVERVFRRLFQARGLEPSQELIQAAGRMFRACSTDYAELYPGAAQLLDDLRQAGRKVYLLSNAQRVFTQPEMRMLDLPRRFDAALLSSDWGIRKPNPDYFQALLRQIPYPRNQILMVGNSPSDDIVPARTLGLRTCFLNTDAIRFPPECDLNCNGADYDALKKALLG